MASICSRTQALYLTSRQRNFRRIWSSCYNAQNLPRAINQQAARVHRYGVGSCALPICGRRSRSCTHCVGRRRWPVCQTSTVPSSSRPSCVRAHSLLIGRCFSNLLVIFLLWVCVYGGRRVLAVADLIHCIFLVITTKFIDNSLV